MSPRIVVAVLTCSVSLVAVASAQQANMGVPFNQGSNSFFEQSGVGFGFRGPGFFFQQNSFGQAIPQFGGFDPSAGATFGFGGPVGNGQAFFNFGFGQGSRSSFSSQSPSVTVGNSATGAFSAGTWTPFVAGVVPVVGDAPIGPALSPSVLEERLSRLPNEKHELSSGAGSEAPSAHMSVDPSLDPFQRQLAIAGSGNAGTPTLSVAQIQQLRNAERSVQEQSASAEIDRLVAQAEAAAEEGKPGVARIYYQQAARRAEGSRKQKLLDRAANGSRESGKDLNKK